MNHPCNRYRRSWGDSNLLPQVKLLAADLNHWELSSRCEPSMPPLPIALQCLGWYERPGIRIARIPTLLAYSKHMAFGCALHLAPGTVTWAGEKGSPRAAMDSEISISSWSAVVIWIRSNRCICSPRKNMQVADLRWGSQPASQAKALHLLGAPVVLALAKAPVTVTLFWLGYAEYRDAASSISSATIPACSEKASRMSIINTTWPYTYCFVSAWCSLTAGMS